MLTKQDLFFIAIVPPPRILEEVDRFKEDFANRFDSRATLNIIPHITLKAPFKSTLGAEEIFEWFERMPISVSAFSQELKNFGAFNNMESPVIYINPIINHSLLNLQQQVLLSYQKLNYREKIDELERNYSPHMTVAYKDLQIRFFKEAWKEYEAKVYQATFEVKTFHLLNYHMKKWNIISTFFLP